MLKKILRRLKKLKNLKTKFLSYILVNASIKMHAMPTGILLSLKT